MATLLHGSLRPLSFFCLNHSAITCLSSAAIGQTPVTEGSSCVDNRGCRRPAYPPTAAVTLSCANLIPSESLGSTTCFRWSHACILGNVCSLLWVDVHWHFDRQTPQVCHLVSLSQSLLFQTCCALEGISFLYCQLPQAEKTVALTLSIPRHCGTAVHLGAGDHMQPDYGRLPSADLLSSSTNWSRSLWGVPLSSSSHCSPALRPSPAIMWALAPDMCRRVYLISTSLVFTHIS